MEEIKKTSLLNETTQKKSNIDTPISIYTDGACSGNPGPGAWAFVIVNNDNRILAEDSGFKAQTTNNRMELSAVINALHYALDNNINTLTLYTDSKYVQQGISEWIFNWKKNNWQTASKKNVKNKDLWMHLDALQISLSIEWRWLKGHAGNVYNERCDELARAHIKKAT